MEGGRGPGAGWQGAPQEAPACSGVGGPPQAPLSLPRRGLRQRPPRELPGARFFSGGVGGARPPGKAPSGQRGQGLQGSVPPQAEPNCQAGRAAALHGGAPLTGVSGGRDGAPRLSHASVPASAGQARAPVPPRAPGSTLPCQHTPSETFPGREEGQGSTWTAQEEGPVHVSSGAPEEAGGQLGVQPHLDESNSSQHGLTSLWKRLPSSSTETAGNFCTAHPRERPSRLPPLRPVLGVQGRAEALRGGRLSAARCGRTRAAAKGSSLSAWTWSAGSRHAHS